ncbi:MAG TPA: type III secretion system export apparatus subunit SctU [Magnetospirillum sp.]|nr:type III secretion system export apparatus subunit SctU [Magnetospirillum sp.]
MSDKTEKPTAKKLRDARKQGQVAYSKDFTQTILLLVIIGYFIGNGPNMLRDMATLIVVPAKVYDLDFAHAVKVVFRQVLQMGASIMAPILVMVLVVGAFADFLQVGVNFAFQAIMPSAKKLNIGTNAKNLFSKKNLVEFLKNVVKVTFLSILIYLVVKDALPQLMGLPPGGVPAVIHALGALVKQVMAYTAVAYVIVGAFDFVYQRVNHSKQLMMSKDEIKREHKESEGDPHIKGKRKQLHQELMNSGMADRTRKSSVLVTNPTHIAVALYYKSGETSLPVVMAKAEDAFALRLMKVAEEAGVPIMRNVPLARALNEQGELDQYVPSNLLEPVAEVLRWVQGVEGR